MGLAIEPSETEEGPSGKRLGFSLCISRAVLAVKKRKKESEISEALISEFPFSDKILAVFALPKNLLIMNGGPD